MKRLIAFCMTLAAIAAVTTGCPPPDPTDPTDPTPDPYKLTGRIENMPSEGSYTLKIVSYPDTEYEDGTVLASTSISADGSFSVDIPGSVDAKYLIPYNESSDWTYGLPHEGVTVSNGNVKFSATYMEVYAGNEYLEDVWYGKSEDGLHVDGFLFFSDGDCDITGNYYNRGVDADVFYDVRVKKGWNWAYGSEIEGTGTDNDGIRLESTAPAGLRFRLY